MCWKHPEAPGSLSAHDSLVSLSVAVRLLSQRGRRKTTELFARMVLPLPFLSSIKSSPVKAQARPPAWFHGHRGLHSEMGVQCGQGPGKYLEFMNHPRTRRTTLRAVKGPRARLVQPRTLHMRRQGPEAGGCSQEHTPGPGEATSSGLSGHRCCHAAMK